MDKEDILKDLYERYYLNNKEYSDVTSSHWRSIGKQNVLFQNGSWSIEGFGFGDLVSRNWKNLIRIFPQLVLSRYLLLKYKTPSKLIRYGIELAKNGKHFFNFDYVRQVLCLDKIIKELKCHYASTRPISDRGIRVVCVIGDGYSYFSNLLRRLDSSIKIITVNLGRTLFFDVFYAYPLKQNNYLLKTQNRKEQFKINDFDTVFLEAEEYEMLQDLPVDLFVNIASMQEMNFKVIKGYFDLMRSSSSEHVYFYCCNRVEKKLPDGTIVRFIDYPWNNCDTIVDELCPWFQRYPISSPPYWKPFDGPVQHKFVRLK